MTEAKPYVELRLINIKIFSPLKLRNGLIRKCHTTCHYSYNSPIQIGFTICIYPNMNVLQVFTLQISHYGYSHLAKASKIHS
jgi:hypothetical protein